MTNLVECWNLLDGRVVELSTWVSATDSEASAGLSIEKLENQLQILKENFAEKEEMLKTLKDNCGPNASYDQNYPTVREETKVETEIQVGQGSLIVYKPMVAKVDTFRNWRLSFVLRPFQYFRRPR